MNRESLPLIAGFTIPIILVSLILLYYYSYDFLLKIISFLKQIDVIYYIVVIPFVLGFVVIIAKYSKTD